jgi:hypothetical protein
MTKDETVSLVNEASQLERRIKDDKKRLDEIKAQLVKLPPGTYLGGADAKAQVIQPEPGIRPAADAAVQAVDFVGPIAAKKLFNRIVSYKPVKDFRAAARAALTPAKAEKVIAMCEVAAGKYVLIS